MKGVGLERVTGGNVNLAVVEGVEFAIEETHGGELVAQVQEEVVHLEAGANMKTNGNPVDVGTFHKLYGIHIQNLGLVIVRESGDHAVHGVEVEIHANMGNDEEIRIQILISVQHLHRELKAEVLGKLSSGLVLFYVRGILNAKAITHIKGFVFGDRMGIGPGQAEAVEIGLVRIAV
jgi:hypothetical protein